MAHAELLGHAATRCLARGEHVVLEGILHAAHDAAMLERLAGAAGDARFFAFETVRRHGLRSKVVDFPADDLRDWYRGWDPLRFVDERRIGPEEDPRRIVERILASRA